MEALKSLYGTSRKADVDMKRVGKKSKTVMPPFPQITKYVYTEAELRMKDATKRLTVGNHTLPFAVPVYVEVCRVSIFNAVEICI